MKEERKEGRNSKERIKGTGRKKCRKKERKEALGRKGGIDSHRVSQQGCSKGKLKGVNSLIPYI